MTKERPNPPPRVHGSIVPGVTVASDWYEYVKADRDWALAEIERLQAENRTLRNCIPDEPVDNPRDLIAACSPSADALAEAYKRWPDPHDRWLGNTRYGFLEGVRWARATAEPRAESPCEHLRSQLLDNESIPEIRQCLNCGGVFRVRSSLNRDGNV